MFVGDWFVFGVVVVKVFSTHLRRGLVLETKKLKGTNKNW